MGVHFLCFRFVSTRPRQIIVVEVGFNAMSLVLIVVFCFCGMAWLIIKGIVRVFRFHL